MVVLFLDLGSHAVDWPWPRAPGSPLEEKKHPLKGSHSDTSSIGIKMKGASRKV
jgi:hypothetical protein